VHRVSYRGQPPQLTRAACHLRTPKIFLTHLPFSFPHAVEGKRGVAVCEGRGEGRRGRGEGSSLSTLRSLSGRCPVSVSDFGRSLRGGEKMPCPDSKRELYCGKTRGGDERGCAGDEVMHCDQGERAAGSHNVPA